MSSASMTLVEGGAGVFLYGFAKNRMANVADDDLRDLTDSGRCMKKASRRCWLATS